MRTRLDNLMAVSIVLLVIAGSLVVIASAGSNPTTSRMRPLVGGIQIETVFNNNGGGNPPGIHPRIAPNVVLIGYCTLGYPVIKNTAYGPVKGFITAAHCRDNYNSVSVYQPNYDSEDANLVGYTFATNDRVDSMMVKLWGGATIVPKIMDVYTPQGAYSLKPIHGLVSWNDTSFIGEIIYKTGRTTMTTSGVLKKYYKYLQLNGVTLEFAVKIVNMNVQPGDSGGPVYWIEPEFGYLYLIGHICCGYGGSVYAIHWEGPHKKLGVNPIISG